MSHQIDDGFRSRMAIHLAQQREKYGRLSVKEILTSTANVDLPKLVEAAASIKMQTLVDAAEIARIVTVGEGVGKTFDIQRIAAPAYRTWTEGSALAAANPTLGSIQGTLAQYGDVVQISDLLQQTSAVDWAASIGEAHGSTVQGAINDKIWTDMKANTTNTVLKSTAGDQSGNILFSDVKTARQKVQSSKWPGDLIVSGPKVFYAWVVDNMTGVQFSTGLAEFVKAGAVVQFLGMKVVIDPLFGETFTGAAGEEYAAVGSIGISVAWGQRGPKFQSETFRDPRELSNYIVSYVTGGAKILEEDSICTIQHS